MPDSEKKKAWMQANTIVSSVKLNRNTDQDIIGFYGDKITASTIKSALRYYMEHHEKENEK